MRDPDDVVRYIDDCAGRARMAVRVLATAPVGAKDAALRCAASALQSATPDILAANAADIAALDHARPAAFVDRLRLTEASIAAMADALETIAALPDPVGRVVATTERPNGLRIERVTVPIGVIGMIYESRPNVAADAGGLCLKSGNAVILRGGSEGQRSQRAIVDCLRLGLREAGLPEDAIQAIATTDRAAVDAMLGAAGAIDLVIPRGGKGLVERVRDAARVPTLLHLDGNNHSYVHERADLAAAIRIVRNAKLRRTGVCGATETIVVDRAIAPQFVPMLADAMPDCDLRGDAEAVAMDPRLRAATDADWDTEYLDAIAAVKVVDDLDAAIAFIAAHGSRHTDAILTEDTDAARRFLAEVDSAIVLHNASTQFADGGEFGMGAEIGIATGRLHARGPVGVEQLTTFKYRVHGAGQTRP